MIVVAAQTLRSRWPLFLGSFIALAFGVLLAASTGLLLTNPALTDMSGLFGTMASIACFVALFVVAGTYAFSVEQRRRELALLRAVGATPRQVRRLIVGETVLVAIAASAVGCVLAAPAAKVLVNGLVHADWIPPGTRTSVSSVALAVAFAVGLVVARLAVWPASRRAGRARPIEALRSVAIEGRVMTVGRWTNGALFLCGAILMMIFIPIAPEDGAMAMSITIVEVLVVALSALAPLVVPPLARLAGAVLIRLTNASGLLAVAGVRGGVRRTASTAAPVLAAVAILGSMVGLTATVNTSDEIDNRQNIAASVVVDPNRTGAGQPEGTVPPGVIDEISGVTGVRATLPVRTADLTIVPRDTEAGAGEDGPYQVAAVDPATLAKVIRVRVSAGDLADLRGNGVAVTSTVAGSDGLRLGRSITVKLSPGGSARLRVVAVVDLPAAVPEILLPLPAGEHWPVDRVFIATDAGLEGQAAADTVQRAIGSGARAWPTADWITRYRKDADRTSLTGVLLLLGMAMVYTVIAVGNTQMMAASQRAADIAVLRRVGATPAQTLRMVVWETCASVTVGVFLGVVTAMISITGVRSALRASNPAAVLVVPWWTFVGVTTVCLAVALAAAVISVLRTAHGQAR